MLYTKFGENWSKGVDSVAKTLKLALDLEVTLTFDLSKIKWDRINAHTLKHVHTKFGCNLGIHQSWPVPNPRNIKYTKAYLIINR